MLAPASPNRIPSRANVMGSTATSGAAAAELAAADAKLALTQPLEAGTIANPNPQTNVLHASPMLPRSANDVPARRASDTEVLVCSVTIG